MLEEWNGGKLENWKNGMVENWNDGRMFRSSSVIGHLQGHIVVLFYIQGSVPYIPL